ncbi:MAG: LytTR family DNA-binding domain-containing protein [Clostridia bacterium]|nr:LytTR family DNA-binding domain-containing protein [Clostridia bacterium]
MLKVLICDDEAVFVRQLGELIARCADERALHVDVVSCSTVAETRELLARNAFDLAIIDLMLPDGSGYDVARFARRHCIAVEIAFVTSLEDHMGSAFRFKPLAYVLKPVTYESVESLFETFLTYLEMANQRFIIDTKGAVLSIPYRDIEYFESFKHNVTVHCINGTLYTYSAKLSDVVNMLPQGRFVRCHQSYAVNIQHISALSKTQKEIVMASGAKLPISRSMRQSVLHICLDSDSWRL